MRQKNLDMLNFMEVLALGITVESKINISSKKKKDFFGYNLCFRLHGVNDSELNEYSKMHKVSGAS